MQAIDLAGPVRPRSIAYSPRYGRLYVAYNTTITYVEPSQSLVEVAFASTQLAINGLASVGDFVLAQDNSGAWGGIHLDRNGRQTEWESEP